MLRFYLLHCFDHLLCLVDALGNEDGPGAALRAFIMGITGPYPIRCVKHLQALFFCTITGVCNEPKGLSTGSRANEIGFLIKDWACRITRCAKDAVGCIVEYHAFFLRL